MKKIELNSNEIVEAWVRLKYPNSCVVVVWVDSTDDHCEGFAEEAFGEHELITSEYFVVEGNRAEINEIMQTYLRDNGSNIPYMQMYVNGEYFAENT